MRSLSRHIVTVMLSIAMMLAFMPAFAGNDREGIFDRSVVMAFAGDGHGGCAGRDVVLIRNDIVRVFFQNGAVFQRDNDILLDRAACCKFVFESADDSAGFA